MMEPLDDLGLALVPLKGGGSEVVAAERALHFVDDEVPPCGRVLYGPKVRRRSDGGFVWRVIVAMDSLSHDDISLLTKGRRLTIKGWRSVIVVQDSSEASSVIDVSQQFDLPVKIKKRMLRTHLTEDGKLYVDCEFGPEERKYHS